MKIVFITDKVYPYFVGGQEKMIYEYASVLVEGGHDVTIASMRWWPKECGFFKDGVRYESVCSRLDLYTKKGKRKILNNLLFGFCVFLYIFKKKVDIVDIQIFPYFPIIFANLALFLKRDKFRIVGHWVECLGVDGWKRYARNFWFGGYVLEKMARLSCDAHVVISEFTKKRMIKLLRIDSKDITVIYPCGLDLQKISAIAYSGEKIYDLVYFGRLMDHKHVEKIISIVSERKKESAEVSALIIGNGPSEASLKAMVRKEGLEKNVIFLDFVDDYCELIRIIKAGKIMVFPSEREGFGISVIEANACGLPVLLLDYPDNAAKELIKQGQNGYLCENFEELLEKTVYLTAQANEKELYRISKSARTCVDKYDKKNIAEKVNAFYSGALC